MTVVRARREPGPPRVAVVASRKVGSAVARNRVKRRLRAALGRVPLEDGNDYIVIASRRVGEVPFTELVGWVRGAIDG